MSESMTVVEIEDVLSSIRRLVSEDLRPTHKLVSAALQKGASKLILTPALRIVSDVRTALPERDDILGDTPDLGSVLSDIEADNAEEASQFVPVFGSVRVQEPVDRPTGDWPLDGGTAPYDANFLTTAMSRINGLSSLADKDLETRGASETIESVVAAVGAAVGPDEWEVDGGDPAPQAEAWSDTVWASAEEPEDIDPQADGAVGTLYLDMPSLPTDTLKSNEPLVHGVQAEPSSQDVLAESGPSLLGEDQIVFRKDSAENPGQRVDDLAFSDSDTDGLDESMEFLNEDILREIVRDMIREELQGTLGERITRNVRKLVRAEINRALATHAFGDVASRA